MLTNWNQFHRHKYFAASLLGVTALLVWLEVRYNVQLLNNISDPTTTTDQANDLANKGKMLAAFGITWVFTRGYLSKARTLVKGLSVVLACSIAGYFVLDKLYSAVIDGLSPEVKVMGFNLLSYRKDLLSGSLDDPDIPNLAEHPVIGKIFMGAFPMVLLDDRFMVPAQDIVERKAQEKVGEIKFLSEKKWSEYNSGMQELDDAYRQFIEGSRKATGGDTFANEWKEYRFEMDRLEGAHTAFVAASRKA